MAPKKALVPRQPAGLPPPALLAKPKALLVPKLVLLKRQHEEEQQRRMRYLRSGAAEAAEEAAAEEEAAADEAWSAWADAQHRLFEEEAEEKAVLDQGDEAAEGRKGVWGYLDDDLRKGVWGYLDDDDSAVQGASKVAKKDDGFDQNDDDTVDSDPEGWTEMAKALPQKFLLKELAQRCPR